MKDKTNDDAKKEGASTENLATPTRSQHFDGHQRAYGRKKVQHYSCYHTWFSVGFPSSTSHRQIVCPHEQRACPK